MELEYEKLKGKKVLKVTKEDKKTYLHFSGNLKLMLDETVPQEPFILLGEEK